MFIFPFNFKRSGSGAIAFDKGESNSNLPTSLPPLPGYHLHGAVTKHVDAAFTRFFVRHVLVPFSSPF